tara:strand:+ start:90 stop:1871 length:1782 start_codon:yes stop_codon:yes gene_type:complete
MCAVEEYYKSQQARRDDVLRDNFTKFISLYFDHTYDHVAAAVHKINNLSAFLKGSDSRFRDTWLRFQASWHAKHHESTMRRTVRAEDAPPIVSRIDDLAAQLERGEVEAEASWFGLQAHGGVRRLVLHNIGISSIFHFILPRLFKTHVDARTEMEWVTGSSRITHSEAAGELLRVVKVRWDCSDIRLDSTTLLVVPRGLAPWAERQLKRTKGVPLPVEVFSKSSFTTLTGAARFVQARVVVMDESVFDLRIPTMVKGFSKVVFHRVVYVGGSMSFARGGARPGQAYRGTHRYIFVSGEPLTYPVTNGTLSWTNILCNDMMDAAQNPGFDRTLRLSAPYFHPVVLKALDIRTSTSNLHGRTNGDLKAFSQHYTLHCNIHPEAGVAVLRGAGACIGPGPATRSVQIFNTNDKFCLNYLYQLCALGASPPRRDAIFLMLVDSFFSETVKSEFVMGKLMKHFVVKSAMLDHHDASRFLYLAEDTRLGVNAQRNARDFFKSEKVRAQRTLTGSSPKKTNMSQRPLLPDDALSHVASFLRFDKPLMVILPMWKAFQLHKVLDCDVFIILDTAASGRHHSYQSAYNGITAKQELRFVFNR